MRELMRAFWATLVFWAFVLAAIPCTGQTLAWEMLQLHSVQDEGWSPELHRGLVTINASLDIEDVRAAYGPENYQYPYRPAIVKHISMQMVYAGGQNSPFWNSLRDAMQEHYVRDENGAPMLMPRWTPPGEEPQYWPSYALDPLSPGVYGDLVEFVWRHFGDYDPCLGPYGVYYDDFGAGWYDRLWEGTGRFTQEEIRARYHMAQSSRVTVAVATRALMGDEFVITFNHARDPNRPPGAVMAAVNGFTIEGAWTDRAKWWFLDQWRICQANERPYWLVSWNEPAIGLPIAMTGSHWMERN